MKTIMAISSAGPPDRHLDRGWVPTAAVSFALPQTAIAAKPLFYRRSKVDEASCSRLEVGELTYLAMVALPLTEAARPMDPEKGSSHADCEMRT